jgi:surfeit locus 1 family protein
MSLPRFRPSIAALLATSLVMAVCLRLAFWQLDRAETKARWQQEQRERAEGEPLGLGEVMALASPGNQPVRVSGRFANDRVILLDNRVLDRIAGYHVLTPLQTDAGDWVLVNRGWLARGPDRNQLPAVPTIPGHVTVEGFSYQYSDRTFTLADDDLSAPVWPLRLQKVEIDPLGEVLGVELAPFEIRVNPNVMLETGQQMPRVWHDAVMGPEKHRGYAVQWFAMALAALLFFIITGLRRPTDPQQDKDA